MKTTVDSLTGKTWIELSKDEVRMGFLAQLIENLSEEEGCSYLEMFRRLEKADMTENYILKHYEAIHSESWENILIDIRELLREREANV